MQSSEFMGRPERSLYVAALAGLCLRLAVTALLHAQAGNAAFIDHDSFGYRELGHNLADTGAYVIDWGDGEKLPGFHRTPGLPVLIAALHTITSANAAVCIVQALLDALAILALGSLGSWLWKSRSAGLGAAWIYALSPGAVLMSNQLMTESSSTSLLILAVWAVVVALDTSKIRWALCAGVLAALSAYVRPTALGLGLILVFLASYVHRKQPKKLLSLGLAVVLCGALITPWMLRNQAQTGRAFFSPLGELKLLNDAAHLRSRIEGIPQNQAFARLGRDAGVNIPDETAAGEAFKDRLKSEPLLLFSSTGPARAYLTTHALTLARYQLPNALRLFVYPHTVRFFLSLHGRPELPEAPISGAEAALRRTAMWVEILVTFGLLVLALSAIPRAWRDRERRWFFLWIAAVVALCGLTAGLDMQARYRLTAEPWLWLLAAPELLRWAARARAFYASHTTQTSSAL